MSTSTNAINAPIPFSVTQGGTGQTSLSPYALLIGNGTEGVSVLAPVSNGYSVLQSTGSSANPHWTNTPTVSTLSFQKTSGDSPVIFAIADTSTGYTLNLPTAQGSSNQTWINDGSGTLSWGTLSIGGGGTGQTSALTAGGIVYGSTTTAMSTTAAGTSGQPLLSGGTGAPTFGTVDIAAGGTGQNTQAAAFNALAPTPTTPTDNGTIAYWNATSASWVVLNSPGSGTYTKTLTLTASGGQPTLSWA